MVLTNHLRDTRSRRYYFDHAFIAVLPDASGLQADLVGRGQARRGRLEEDRQVHGPRPRRSGHGIYSGKTAKYRLPFYLVDGGGTATRDVRVGTALASFPVWAFATDSTPGSTSGSSSRPGSRPRSRPATSRRRPTGRAGRVVFQTAAARQADRLLRLPRRRPAGRVRRAAVATRGRRGPGRRHHRRPGPTTRRGPKRVGGLVRRALPALSARIGQPWPRDGGLVIQEAVAARPAATPGCSTRRRGAGGDRLFRRRSGRPPRERPRLVQRVAAGRSLGERGVRVVLRVRGGRRTSVSRASPTR